MFHIMTDSATFFQQTIGDEYHMVLECPHFITERRKYVKRYFYKHPNTLKFESLMNCTNKNVLANLCNFIKIIGPRQASLVLIGYASSEGSGEPAHPRSLARTSAARSYKQ